MKIEDFVLNIKEDKIPWRLVHDKDQNKDWCVLWLQGWTSSMDSHLDGIKRMVEESGVTYACLDYAGHGKHDQDIETSTRKQQFNEVVAIYDELINLGYKKIVVIGGSFGGYMAALLAGEKQPYSIVLRAPANYPDNELSLEYRETDRHKNYTVYAKRKKSFNEVSKNKALQSVKGFEGFSYIIEHELDEVIPKNLPLGYFNASKNGNYIIIPNTKHSPKLAHNPKEHYVYIEDVLTSIIRQLKYEL